MQTERHAERQREKDRQTVSWSERDRERKTDRQCHGVRETERERQTDSVME